MLIITGHNRTSYACLNVVSRPVYNLGRPIYICARAVALMFIDIKNIKALSPGSNLEGPVVRVLSFCVAMPEAETKHCACAMKNGQKVRKDFTEIRYFHKTKYDNKCNHKNNKCSDSVVRHVRLVFTAVGLCVEHLQYLPQSSVNFLCFLLKLINSLLPRNISPAKVLQYSQC